MWPRLRLLLGVTIVAIIGSFISFETVSAEDGETYFVATAYYSPLPWQSKYTTWSYAWDKRLNGEWHTTASGKSVFPGILAWPKNYPFWTKIYFEGFGIGVIEDRWGAIVKAWERWHSYDRIDIWMWYGDEWLARALQWGTRTVKGKIVVPSAEVTLAFPESKIWSLTKLQVNPENHTSEDVKKLQIIFTKADLYDGAIDGAYSSIKNELIDFQIKSGVIASKSDDAAGWYGNKTIAALREKYWYTDGILIEEAKENFERFNHRNASEKYKIILEYWDLTVDPESESEKVKLLQELLTDLWEYEWSVDGKYKSVEDELIALQKKIGLISKSDDWGAWYFWNKTKSALWEYYELQDDRLLEDHSLSDSELPKIEDELLKQKLIYLGELID